jgi:hypothetical protein
LSVHCAFLDLGFWFCSFLFVLCTYWITSWNLFYFGYYHYLRFDEFFMMVYL